MANPYVGEIRMFGGSFAPLGWAFCNGSLLSIEDYDTLFALLGTTYGGDGQNTFALPDLRGRVPIHIQGSNLGESGGVEEVTISSNTLPIHNHAAGCKNAVGNSTSPVGGVPAINTTALGYGVSPPQQNMNNTKFSLVGGSQPHNNMQPFLCITFIIATEGIFPTQ